LKFVIEEIEFKSSWFLISYTVDYRFIDLCTETMASNSFRL